MIMQGQLTNISCVMGLFIIFLMAAYLNSNYLWIAGIFVLLVILIVRNVLGEVSLKTDLLLSVLSWVCILLTFLLVTERL